MRLATYRVILITKAVIALLFVGSCDSQPKTVDEAVRKGASVGDTSHVPLDPKASFYQLRDIITTDIVDAEVGAAKYNLPAKPNIYMFMIDTVRKDYVEKEYAPNIVDFAKRSDVVSFNNNFASAVSTYYSTTSVYYSMLSHIRSFLINDGYKAGAVNLALMKKAGYKIHLYARTSNYFCTDPGKSIDSLAFEHNMFLFSAKPRELLARCNEYVPKAANLSYADYDQFAITAFRQEFNGLMRASNDGNLFLFFLDGAHTPFSWKNPSVIYTPFMPNVTSDADVLIQDPKEHEMIRNSYKNAISGADHQFGRFIEKLKNEGAFDDAIIVLFSDHGERLFDKRFSGDDKFRVGHTDYGYNAIIENMLYIRIPHSEDGAGVVHDKQNQKRKALLALNSSGDSVGSNDIFPTLYDILELKVPPNLQRFMNGKSLLKPPTYFCQANYAPDWDKAPHYTFVERDLKAYVTMESEIPHRSKLVAFKIIHMNERSDKRLSEEEIKKRYNFDLNDRAQADRFLESHFKDCMEQIVDLRTKRQGYR